jgi:hypothetical protein
LLQREGVSILSVRVDEDGALANSAEFTDFLLRKSINLETTGGYASFLNGKIERHHRTLANMVRAMILNANLSSSLWCYAAETAADVYRYTHHSALDKTPYEAWYGHKPHINNLRVWGCYVYVRVPDPKKLDNRVIRGNFLGFTKSRLIIRYWDPSTSTVKHAHAVRFDELNTRLNENDPLSPGALILSGTETPTIETSTTVDITDHPHLDTPPFTIQLALPPLPTFLGCELSTDTYHNLPYISKFHPGTPLATSLLLHGRYNSSFWILSLNSKEFITAEAVAKYLTSLRHASKTVYISCILAR